MLQAVAIYLVFVCSNPISPMSNVVFHEQDKATSNVGQEPNKSAVAYKKWFEANAAKDYPKAIRLARDYIERFPEERATEYLKEWLEYLQKGPVEVQTYLRGAADSGSADCLTEAQMLDSVTQGRADGTTRTCDGRSALMLAATRGQADLIRVLLEKGVDIDAREAKHGWTALIYGIWSGDPETVQLLIEGGADLNLKDEENATVLDNAILRDNPAIVKLLKKAGAR